MPLSVIDAIAASLPGRCHAIFTRAHAPPPMLVLLVPGRTALSLRMASRNWRRECSLATACTSRFDAFSRGKLLNNWSSTNACASASPSSPETPQRRRRTDTGTGPSGGGGEPRRGGDLRRGDMLRLLLDG